jgi:hypothetical protein
MLMRTPEVLPGSSGNDYNDIRKKITASYDQNATLWQVFWTEATIDTRLETGDTTLMSQLSQDLPNTNRGSWYFNRVRPLCSMVSGYQRRNRKSTVVVPLERGDQETADQWTKILMHLYKKEDIYETISDAFHQGACITGMNLLHVYLDYQSDPVSGDIKVDNLAYNSFFVDPYFRKADLSDAAFVWRRSYLTHQAAAALMPNKTDEIMQLAGNSSGVSRDGRFQYMPEAYGQSYQNFLSYDEYYYRSFRPQKLLVDKETGETFEITNQEDIDIETFLTYNPQITLIEQDVPTVRLAILIQDKVFYDGPSGLDRYPFIPVLGFYNPMMPYFYSRIQGLCRSLRDPQILLNRRIILSADMLESQVNSGFIFKENAVVDVNHLFQTGQGRIIPLKSSAQMTDIQPIIPPQIPPSFFQIQETFSKELSLVSGINEELMGFNYDDKSGYRSALQQGAGLTTLQPLFDRLDAAQNMLGELIMEVVRANYTPGKITNILEGAQPAPLFYNKAFGKYHCQVENGFNTETQKQMQFLQLTQLAEMGLQIPPKTLINAATLQNKEELIKDIEEMQQQQSQLQQQQAQSQMALQQAQAGLAQAKIQSDLGLAQERATRSISNIGLAEERRMEAAKDLEQAALDRIKALKELESMDYEHLEKLIAMSRIMKENIVEEDVPQTSQNGSGLGRKRSNLASASLLR